MKFPEVVEILKRITYKPGFRITLNGDPWGVVHFGFEHQVPNADRKYVVETTGQWGTKGSGSYGANSCYETILADVLHSEVPSHATVGRKVALSYRELEYKDEREFLRWLFYQIDVLEDHEQEEFFRVDGKPLIEPHPEKATAKVHDCLIPNTQTMPKAEALIPENLRLTYDVQFTLERLNKPQLTFNVSVEAHTPELAIAKATREICLGWKFHQYESIFEDPHLRITEVTARNTWVEVRDASLEAQH